MSPDDWTGRVRSVYDRTARGYDLALAASPVVGFRAGAYRRAAIASRRSTSGLATPSSTSGAGPAGTSRSAPARWGRGAESSASTCLRAPSTEPASGPSGSGSSSSRLTR